MLAIGNNSRIQCDDEAAFWDTFFIRESAWELDLSKVSFGGRTYTCPEPLCGYRSWKDLCQTWRLSFVSLSTGQMFHSIVFTAPILALIFIVLVGSGRIARTVDGELDLKRLLAPHILLILGLAAVSFFITL